MVLRGAIQQLPAVIAGSGDSPIMLVASAGTLSRVRLLDLLADFEVRSWSDWSPNPRLEEALTAASLVESLRPGVIVGVGGGSALDLAKLARCLPADEREARTALAAKLPWPPVSRPQLVLAPTTAGPGAEVTRFAAVYVDGRKRSLEHEEVMADAVLIDPLLLHTCPRDVIGSCALDGLAQSIESVLALRSTPASRRLATEALPAFRAVLKQIDSPSGGVFADVSRASSQVGRAINVSRTTAGHAFAYPLTAHYGVPHGLACALQLTWLLPYWCATMSEVGSSAADLPERFEAVAAASGVDSPELLGAEFRHWIELAGFSPHLGDHGVQANDLDLIAAEALDCDRAGNSPLAVDRKDAVRLMRSYL